MWQIVIEGPGHPRSTFLLPEGLTSIGRAEDNDIILNGSAVSRYHARLEVKEGHLYLQDLGSRNGTNVNSAHLMGTTPLHPTDSIQLGENLLTVRLPARLENLYLEDVDLHAGGLVRRKDALDLRWLMAHRPVARRSLSPWVHLAVEPWSAPPSARSFPQVLLLSEAADKTNDAESFQRVLDEGLACLLQELNATTVVVMFRHSKGPLVPLAVAKKPGLLQTEVRFLETMAERAMVEGDSLAYHEPDTTQQGRITGGHQMLCSPLPNGLGVLFVNRAWQLEEELPSQLELMGELGDIFATAFANARLEEQAKSKARLRLSLERFHAPHIAEKRSAELIRKGQAPLAHMEQRNVAVLFADLSSFTALTEALPTNLTVDLLGSFYDRMARIIFSFEGTLDKFLGDSVMALFGAPYPKEDDVLRASRCALAMRYEWDRLMARRPDNERCQLQVGLAWGQVLVGTVGSAARLDYTAIGEPVNLASWLCQRARPGQILATHEFTHHVGPRIDLVPLGIQSFRQGKSVGVFEIEDEDRARATTL